VRIDNFHPLWTKLPWTKIEWGARPVPNDVLRGSLKLRLGGRGTAYFSNVRWEAID
jgi:hypothetical protein